MSSESDFFLKKTISRQITPLGCQRFIITATKPKFDKTGSPVMRQVRGKNKKPLFHKDGSPVMTPSMIGINLCRASKDAVQISWTLQNILQDDNLLKMKSLNVKGFAIFITPQEQDTDKIFILIDDTSEAIIDIYGKPNIFLQTSPKSQQAIYTVPYIYHRDLYNKIFMYINLMYGDHRLLGLRHPFRLAGFSNRKPKYMDEQGCFPFVKTISTTREISQKLTDFIEECAAGTFPLLEEIQRLKALYRLEEDQLYAEDEDKHDIATDPTPAPNTPRSTLHPRPGMSADHRGKDFSTALRAAWQGMEGEALESHIAENSDHILDPCGYDMNFEAYIEKTAANAAATVAVAKANHRPRPTQPNTEHRYNGAKSFLAKKQAFILKRREAVEQCS